jgi:HAD superfamily phosphatase (TIGR01668 family)
MALFYPDRLVPRITDIDIDALVQAGVRGLLLDVDNTLTTHDNPDLSPAVREWLQKAEQAGISAVIVSNNRAARARPFAEAIGLPFVAKARKPLRSGFRRAAALLGLQPEQCLVIGDQVFTDVLGARWSGIACIQVLPIEAEKGQHFIAFKRMLEKPIVKRFMRKQKEKQR